MKFEDFVKEIEPYLNKYAEDKGYGSDEKGKHLSDSIMDEFGPSYALGEIRTKLSRYHSKGNYEDLLKIAAWTYLVYRWHVKNKHVEPRDVQLKPATRRCPNCHKPFEVVVDKQCFCSEPCEQVWKV